MGGTPAASVSPSRRRGPVRSTLRWGRRTACVLGILLLAGFGYLNQIGLPDWIKDPLLEQLAERGIDLDFERIRVRLGRGLVAESVQLRLTADERGEEFRAEGLHLKLGWSALLGFRPPEVLGVRLMNGQALLPLGGEEPPLLFDDVNANLLFLDGATWRLEDFRGHTRGGWFEAAGMLRNPAALRSARRDRPRTVAWAAVRRRMQAVVEELRATDFDREPALDLRFDADFLHPERSRGELGLIASGVRTRLGRLEGAEFRVRLNEPEPLPGELRLEVSLRASGVSLEHFEGRSVDLDAGLRHRMTNAMPSEWFVDGAAGGVAGPWGHASRVSVSARSSDTPRPADTPMVDLTRWWTGPLQARWTNLATLPAGDLTARVELDDAELSVEDRVLGAGAVRLAVDMRHDLAGWYGGRMELGATNVVTAWGSGDSVDLTLEARPRADPPEPDDRWGPWQWLVPVTVEAGLNLTGVRVPRPDPENPDRTVEIPLDAAGLLLGWSAPGLEIRRLDARVGDGTLGAEGTLDVPSRRVRLDATAAVDAHRFAPLLTAPARRWMGQFGWPSNDPPRLRAALGVVLPAWDDRKPDWRGEVVPTLTIAGDVRGNRFSFRGVRGSAADGTFTYTNRVWDLPRIDVTAPEGELAFSYRGDERTKDYHFHITSRMDPSIARPLAPDPRAERAFDQASFGEAPVVVGDVWGRWKEPERIGADLHVVLTNAVIRGEPLEAAAGRVTYTNGVAVFTDVGIRSDGEATIPGATYDIGANLLSFTNAWSTLPVARVTRVIGPSATRVMDRFTFRAAPRVHVEGVVPVRDIPGADIRFDAEVPDVEWWRLRGSNVTARVAFVGDELTVSDLRGGFVGGQVGADIRLDLADGENPLVRFEAEVTNASLRRIVLELFQKTNALEGEVTGRLSVGDSRSLDTNSWNATGEFSMRDGFLWGIPIFGVFSPLFEALSPGLGETRFRSGTLGFTLTNGLISTRDLRLHSPAMRLDYRGTVDLEGRLDAFMEARLLRDTPIIGPILNVALSPVTKLLEYRVGGTLGKPEAEPRYIPRFLLGLLQPIRTLRNLLPEPDSPAVVEMPVAPKEDAAPADPP